MATGSDQKRQTQLASWRARSSNAAVAVKVTCMMAVALLTLAGCGLRSATPLVEPTSAAVILVSWSDDRSAAQLWFEAGTPDCNSATLITNREVVGNTLRIDVRGYRSSNDNCGMETEIPQVTTRVALDDAWLNSSGDKEVIAVLAGSENVLALNRTGSTFQLVEVTTTNVVAGGEVDLSR